MTTKMTYSAALSFVLDNVTDLPEDVIERLTALKTQTDKRNATPTKRVHAADKPENVALADRVTEVLRMAATPLTVSEIMSRDDVLATLSTQKASAVIRGMGAKVVKTVDKRVSRFALA